MPSRKLEAGFFIALLAIAIFLAWLVFQPYLGVLVLAGTLAFIFHPLYKGLIRAVRYESLAAFLSVIFIALIVFVPLGFFGVRVFGEASTLYTTLTSNGGFDFGTVITHSLHSLFPNLPVPDISLNFNDAARQGLAWLMGNLGSFFSGLAQAIFAAFLSLIGLFYFLKDGDRLEAWMVELFPLAPEYTEAIIHEMEAVLSSVVKGTLVMAVIQGLVVGIGFALFGVPNPAFWGGLTVIVTLVPIVGTWLVVVPAIGYLFFTGQTVLSVGLAIWSVVLVNLVYNFVAPQIMHRGVNIHSYIILLSVLGGIAVFGPIGFLMGPLIVALLFSLLSIYPKLVLKRKK